MICTGRADGFYPVEVDGVLTYECDCQAGKNRRVCWHAALIAALPGECSRRRAHRAQRQAAIAAPAPRVAPLAELFA